MVIYSIARKGNTFWITSLAPDVMRSAFLAESESILAFFVGWLSPRE
jgi:hypothetical protein